jgi:hypothetical protein
MMTQSQQKLHNRNRSYRKRSFWQIWFPIVFSILVVLAIAVLVAIFSARDIQGNFNVKWASISLIYLIFPTMFVALIFLAIIVALIYGISKILGILPTYTKQVQLFMLRASTTIHQGADKTVLPFFFIQSWIASLRTVFKK